MSASQPNVNNKCLFQRHPWEDKKKVREDICEATKGPHIFFRRLKTNIQARLHELMDLSSLPQVFLHGSPHLDNYARTNTGSGVIDFDRAHIGPYAWDLVCFLISLSLRQAEKEDAFVDEKVADEFFAGYLHGVTHTDSYQVYQELLECKPKRWETSGRAYLAAGKKWAAKLHAHPLPADDILVHELVHQYFMHRDEVNKSTQYVIEKAGRVNGTFGRVHYIIALAPANTADDLLLLDIKHVRNYDNPLWPHNRLYHHDFAHQGKRMIAASQLYAPGVTANESYATLNGIEYWARELPTQNWKISTRLTKSQQASLAFAVGTQLGRGHSLSLQAITPRQLLSDLEKNKAIFLESMKIIRQELFDGWCYYVNFCNKIKK